VKRQTKNEVMPTSRHMHRRLGCCNCVVASYLRK